MKTVRVGDLDMAYEEQGSGAPVLLLHGLGSSSADWELVAPKLAAAGYRVLMPDVRGHGNTAKPEGAYSVPLFAEDIARFCDALGVTAAHVVGLSMGGMIAFQLAVSRPALVKTLTIVNSGPDMVPRTLKVRLLLGSRVLMARWLGPRRMGPMLARRLFPRPEQEELRRVVGARLASNDPDAYLRSTRALVGWSVLDRLGQIACPVLVLASDRDYTPVAAKEAYVAKLRNARLVVLKDSGHAAPADAPAALVDELLRFLG